MLVLSRVAGQLIAIGDNISIRVVAINGNDVRFGVEAPREISVHRSEIYERIKRNLPKKKKSVE